jgi:hypothetical protein
MATNGYAKPLHGMSNFSGSRKAKGLAAEFENREAR